MQSASSTDAWRQRLKVVRHDLSFRELEVAAGMLAGKTLREIAASLGVAHSTAITYRERAYRRLGVQNLKALRQLFMRGLSVPIAWGQRRECGVTSCAPHADPPDFIFRRPLPAT